MSMRRLIDLVESPSGLLEVLLYRGDGEHIEQFDILKTDYAALFGRGIYLTTDPDVAHDYTTAKGTHRVYPVDRDDPVARTPKDLIRGYAHRLAADFNERAWKDEWVRKNGLGSHYSGLSNSDHRRMDYEMTQAKRASVQQRWRDALARVKRELPQLRVLKLTTGELRLVKVDRPAAVSVFDIPEEYLARTLHGDRPLPDHALKAIKRHWRTVFKGHDGDLRDGNENIVNFDTYVKNYRENGTRYAWRDEGDDEWWRGGKGENPTLDDLMNGTIAGFHALKDGGLIKALQDLGYVGIEYDGGKRVKSSSSSTGAHVRGGGGRRHRAFVFWNTDDLHRFRRDNAPLPAGKRVTARSLPPETLP